MGKLIILSGISGSGKTTYSNEKWKENPEKIIRVNRDKIREMLFGYVENNIKDYYKKPDVFKFEKQVSDYEHLLISYGLKKNKDVIVDNTHLKLSYINEYSKYNATTDLVFFIIDKKDCEKRDQNRIRKVGSDVINRQSIKFNTLLHTFKINNSKGIIYKDNYKFNNKI